MRKETWLPAVALASGLVLGAGTVAFTTDSPPGGTFNGSYNQRGGKHPHIAAAERALTQAAGQLERATFHYGGHRAKALELVRQAEGQLREGIVYADAHPEEFKQGAAARGAPAKK